MSALTSREFVANVETGIIQSTFCEMLVAHDRYGRYEALERKFAQRPAAREEVQMLCLEELRLSKEKWEDDWKIKSSLENKRKNK